MDPAREIENLLHLYAERMDAGDFEGVGALFERAAYGAEGGDAVHGAAAVSRLLAAQVRRYEDGTPKTRHLVTNARIEVDEATGTATARSTFTVLQAVPPRGPGIVVVGRYHDRLVREDGRWRFAERRMAVEQAGDLSLHLRDPGLASR
jgi:3-phenylpropionate/cinnamic acid dioxygenase small subunit